jgi:glycosyltransferase involved in cell wall biosynthesis
VVRILGAPSPPHAAYERGVWEEATQLGLGDPRDFDIADPGQRVPELIHAFDVLALTSVPRSEGMPTVILEAMAAGLPVVATRVGAVAEVVEEGVTGFVVPPLGDDAMASALARLAADPELRRRLGEEGRRRVRERYDIEPLADRHAEAYRVALEHRRNR